MMQPITFPPMPPVAPPPSGGPGRLAQIRQALGRARATLKPWALPLLALALVAVGLVPVQALGELAVDGLLWLLLCAFVIAAVLQASGLAERLALRVTQGAASVAGLCWRLSALVAATAFVMPSTSARAALLLPVFLSLAQALGAPRAVRALALLFPTIVLLSAGASLTGAGAHLVAGEAMQKLGGGSFGFARWAWLGAPLALAACAGATWLILRLFLNAEERAAPAQLPPPPEGPATRAQRIVGVLCLGVVGLWLAAPALGIPILAVAAVGALAATRARWTGVGLTQALKKVDWRLLATLAALMLLTDAVLSASDAERRLAAVVQALWPAEAGPAAAIALAALLAVVSHLLVASRTARATVLIPLVALPLAGSGADPALLVFICVQGSGFCQTFSWCAKPVTIFSRQEAFSRADLLRLALPLGLGFAALLSLFALVIWPLQGLG